MNSTGRQFGVLLLLAFALAGFWFKMPYATPLTMLIAIVVLLMLFSEYASPEGTGGWKEALERIWYGTQGKPGVHKASGSARVAETAGRSAQYQQMRQTLIQGGRKDVVSLAEELASIGIDNDGYPETTTGGKRARTIGHELDAMGGFRAMQEMHKLVVYALLDKTDHENAATYARRLESAWHGIGQWLG